MNYKAAMAALAKGKPVRRAAWPAGQHMVRDPKTTGFEFHDASGSVLWVGITGPDSRAEDWQEFTT